MSIKDIRNFSIIAHIDHGKSTLCDRFLELTHTIEAREMQAQFLDQMELERERGITIKLQPVRMAYHPKMQNLNIKVQNDNVKFKNENTSRSDTKIFNFDFYILNLIDTPGHVDFSYEVSRSLAAVEGAILLVDGTKGIQAQTLAHLHQAQKQGLVIIPAINKIDLVNARPGQIESELRELLGSGDIFHVSAKLGTNVGHLLAAVIEKVPPPRQGQLNHSRALIFDSIYDVYKGVVAYVRVFDGEFRTGSKIKFLAQNKYAEILEVGYFKPKMERQKVLAEGEIGYVATGLKDPSLVRVGDTIAQVKIQNSKFKIRDSERKTTPEFLALPGYQEPQPVVFAGLFPKEGEEFSLLKEALLKLKLSDAALNFEPESQEVLGRGFRCGFLGSLHLEIVLERLRREYKLNLIATTPSVGYQVIFDKSKIKPQVKEIQMIFSAAELPSPDQFKEIREPWVKLVIITPTQYLGPILQLVSARRGVYQNTHYLSPSRAEITFEMPLAEIIVDFYDQLKSISSGFASLSYELLDFRKGDLVRLDILVAGEQVSAMSRLVPKGQAQDEGKRIVARLKELLPRQWFQISLQAAIGGKIIAREDISALKKDVTGYLYGGDITRKMKLREKQKRGKKKLKAIGKVNIPSSVYLELLKR